MTVDEKLHALQVRVPALGKRIGAEIIAWMRRYHHCKCKPCNDLMRMLKDPPLVEFMIGFPSASVIQRALITSRSDYSLMIAWSLSSTLAEAIEYCTLPAGIVHQLEQAHALTRERVRSARIQYWFAREWMHVEPGERLDRLMNEARLLLAKNEFAILDDAGFQFDNALRARIATLADWIAQQIK